MKDRNQAEKLLKDSFVWDQSLLWADAAREDEILDRLAGWGVNGASLKINPAYNMAASWFQTNLTAVVTNRMMLKERAGAVLLSQTGDVRAGDKTVFAFSLSDTSVMENPARDIELFSALGVTTILLAALHNLSGSSCYDEDGGLTRYGKRLVAGFNESDLYLDGALSGYRTSMEAMSLSEKPFLFSHTNPYSVCQNRRNIRDDQIKACAATGGVVGITFIGAYLGNETPDAMCVFRNIDHLCQLTGPEHVGIGSNYMLDTERYWSVMRPMAQAGELAGGTCFDYAKLPEVVALMLSHGYKEADVRKILGENWLRLFA